MPNNPADVPLLTQEDAEHIWNLLPVSNSRPEMHRDLSLDALASGTAVTKSAAAEEADRARIAKMRAALSQASFCIRELLPDDPDAKMTVGIINEALSGASENE